MNKLVWCCKQNKGIDLIEPNENLADGYTNSSEENLLAMVGLKGKWKAITAYYACYDILYALLQKVGIKCEIHDCSIELLNLFDIGREHIDFIQNLKKERINVQYYLKKPKEVDDIKVKNFVNDCRILMANVTEDKINEVRGRVQKLSQ